MDRHRPAGERIRLPAEDGELKAVEVSRAGEISYRVLARDENYWESEEVLLYPEFDHVGPTREEAQPYDGENGPGALIYILASAPSIAAFASIIKVYLRRNKDRMVRVYWKDGTPRLEVTGDLSVEEIERLLRARLEDPGEDQGLGDRSASDEPEGDPD